jgi:hypothetical protein
MENFFGFICLSCNSLQPETFIDPFEIRELYASICCYCGQVIPEQTKQMQLDDYCRVHTVVHEEKVDYLNLKKKIRP